MASGTADLQRDLGGAIMQSILGALLTAGAIIGVLLGAALVFFMFPRHEAEIALLGRYQAEDSQPAPVPARAPRPRAAHRKH